MSHDPGPPRETLADSARRNVDERGVAVDVRIEVVDVVAILGDQNVARAVRIHGDVGDLAPSSRTPNTKWNPGRLISGQPVAGYRRCRMTP